MKIILLLYILLFGSQICHAQTWVSNISSAKVNIVEMLELPTAMPVMANPNMYGPPMPDSNWGWPWNTGTWNSKFDSLAKYYEAKFNFPHGICHAFAARESDHYDIHSLRTEKNYINNPKVMAEAKTFSKKNGGIPSVLTEVYQRGTSVGLFQVMFENYRFYGFIGKFITDVTLKDQFEIFSKMFNDLLKRYHGNVRNAVSAWNHGKAFKGFDAYADGSVRGVMHYLEIYSY